jgi:hypothetical protein
MFLVEMMHGNHMANTHVVPKLPPRDRLGQQAATPRPRTQSRCQAMAQGEVLAQRFQGIRVSRETRVADNAEHVRHR